MNTALKKISRKSILEHEDKTEKVMSSEVVIGLNSELNSELNDEPMSKSTPRPVIEIPNQSAQDAHVFCTFGGRIPDGFRQAFSASERIDLLDLVLAPMTEGLVTLAWLQLTPGSTVASQITRLRECVGNSPVIIMSDIPNDMEALAAFSVAAKGYCNTHAGAEVLLKIASVVEQGGIWIGESIMQRLLNAPVEITSNVLELDVAWGKDLSLREKQVAKEVAAGASNKEIAQKLVITERTVKAHVGAVLEKLHLKSRLQLALLVKGG
ncbi:MAG: response regulator transcription factor [Undibacterium sp.]|nr:response regulator transcription factor [Undibacterium sp.]